MTELKNQKTARVQLLSGLGNEIGVKLVAFLTAIQCNFWLVVADFAHERFGFAATDVWRVAYDEIE